MERATDLKRRNAIVIALGQPSDPLPHDEAMRLMAARVEERLPGWTVRGATLESPESVRTAAEGLDRPLVYPLFLTSGFFLAEVLPKRLARLLPGARIMPPFGEDPAIPRLVSDILLAAAALHDFAIAGTDVLLAAHGSETYTASRLSTERLASGVSQQSGFRRIFTGYIEESPFIEESARDLGQAICLPVFALSASHVAVDIPAALAKAGYRGVTLPPLGMHDEVPTFIADALRRHALQEAA
jgi:sirohydrochlorin ferrochelatase